MNEKIIVIYENHTLKAEKIYSNGINSPEGFWYCQKEAEWVSLMSGEAELEFEDNVIHLKKGENFMIPRFMKHRVASASTDCVWFCIYFK